MLKKVLLVTTLVVVLAGMTLNTALAVGEGGNCCPGGSATDDCDPGLTCVGFTDAAPTGDCTNPVTDKLGTCQAAVTSLSSRISECCKLGHDVITKTVTYKDGAIVGAKAGVECKHGEIPDEKCEDLGTVDKDVACHTKDWGLICMLNTVYVVTDWLFYIMILIAVVMAIVGGFMYMTAAGDPEKAGKGKSVLIFAMIGFAIALLSKAIPSIVRAVMGM